MAETEYEVSLGGQTVTFRGDAALSDQDVLRQAAVQLSQGIPTNAQGQVESGPMAAPFREADPGTTLRGAVETTHQGGLGQAIRSAGRMLNFDTPTGAAMTGLGLPLIAKAGGLANTLVQGAAKIPYAYGLGAIANMGLRHGLAPAAEIGTDAALSGAANYVLGENPGAGATAGGTMGAIMAIARRSPTTAKAIFGALFGAGGAELGGGDPIKGALLGAGAGVLAHNVGSGALAYLPRGARLPPGMPIAEGPGQQPSWLNTADPQLLKAQVATNQARAAQAAELDKAAREQILALANNQTAAVKARLAEQTKMGEAMQTAYLDQQAKTIAGKAARQTAEAKDAMTASQAGLPDAGPLSQQAGREMAVAAAARGGTRDVGRLASEVFGVPNLHQNPMALYETVTLKGPKIAHEAFAQGLADIEATVPTLSWGRGENAVIDMGTGEAMEKVANLGRRAFAGKPNPVAQREYKELTAGIESALPEEERNFFIQLKRDYARRRGLTALLDMNPLDPATLHVDPEAIRATLVKGPSARRLVQREGEDAFKELLQAFGIGRGSVAEVGSRLPLSHAP